MSEEHEDQLPFADLRARYQGPPPVPPDEAIASARAELGLEVTAHVAEYV